MSPHISLATFSYSQQMELNTIKKLYCCQSHCTPKLMKNKQIFHGQSSHQLQSLSATFITIYPSFPVLHKCQHENLGDKPITNFYLESLIQRKITHQYIFTNEKSLGSITQPSHKDVAAVYFTNQTQEKKGNTSTCIPNRNYHTLFKRTIKQHQLHKTITIIYNMEREVVVGGRGESECVCIKPGLFARLFQFWFHLDLD